MANKSIVSPEVSESYSQPEAFSSADSTPFEDDAFSESRQFTFQVLLGSAASQLQILRFELRVLRFFNDICLPHITYNVNQRHVAVWERVVPQYFSHCRLIKLAILATGCLSLMPVMGMQKVIDDGMSEDEILENLKVACGQYDIQLMFVDDTLFNGKEINLFTLASEHLQDSMKGIQEAIYLLQSPDLSHEEKLPYLIGASIGNSFLYGFLGLHPWKLVPLVDFSEDRPRKTDLLDIGVGLKTMIIDYLGPLLESDIGELYHYDELTLIPRFKIKIIEELRKQLNEHLQSVSFFDIDLERNHMINTYRDCLSTLEKVCGLAVKFNYPVMLFRYLLLIETDYVKYVRAKEPFALRLLYVYLCLCVHYKFWLFECNMWRDFAVYYRRHFGPLCEFDERLYHYVVTRRQYVLFDNYRGIKDLDVWAPVFDYEHVP